MAHINAVKAAATVAEWDAQGRQIRAWSCPVAYRVERRDGRVGPYQYWVKPDLLEYHLDPNEKICKEVDLRSFAA